ncbi:MAG: hypothetical protein CL961_00885 [Euryarchaeota archaeon]|nr:hypothetical protein [Euryarchaeota archaeon]
MRFLLTSHGSTGDIFPMIRLGHALVQAGHHVRFATVNLFKNDVEAAGLCFVHLPPDWDQNAFAEAMRDLTKSKNSIDLLKIIYSEAEPFLDDIIEILRRELETTDVFVCNYIFGNLCQLARKMEVPCAVTTFAHNAIPSYSKSPITLPRFLTLPHLIKKPFNKFSWKIADKILCWNINQVLGETLRHNEIGQVESYLIDPADKILVTVSPGLFQPKQTWNDSFTFTGYLRWQAAEDPVKEKALIEFCQGEKVPILTFGSVTFENTRKIMRRFLKNWPENKKIIIQTGWAQLTIEQSKKSIFSIDRISHDQLFKFASVVIHHGGAGTTASVLHAGVPQIIIPHIGDQKFFAKEVRRLRVGLSMRLSRWPEQLPRAVRIIERSKRRFKKARAIAKILSKENGPKNAVIALENLAQNNQYSNF